MLEYQVVQIMSATTPFFTLSLLFRICLLLLETQRRSDYVCCHPKPTIGQIMSATTLNLYYVQIMSATEPPPLFSSYMVSSDYVCYPSPMFLCLYPPTTIW